VLKYSYILLFWTISVSVKLVRIGIVSPRAGPACDRTDLFPNGYDSDFRNKLVNRTPELWFGSLAVKLDLMMVLITAVG